MKEIVYSKSLLQSAIISDIFALCELAIHIHSQFVDFVSRVLVDDALSSVPKRGYSCIVPPLLHVAIFIELAT